MGSLNLSRILLYPFGTDVCEVPSADASENDRYEVRWYSSLHRLSEHGLLDLALLKS